jgi:ACR3 family arsenite transporter
VNKLTPPLFILLPTAIIMGLASGKLLPSFGESLDVIIDPLVLALLVLLLFEVRLKPLRVAQKNLSIIGLSWVVNFLLIPVIGWAIASVFFGGQDAIFLGLFLYFLFPCTDWFLAFTKIAKGDTELGAALIPINLVSQLLLFPLYLLICTGMQTNIELQGSMNTLIDWFILPFASAFILRFFLYKMLSTKKFKSITSATEWIIPWVLFLLVYCIFSSNTGELTNSLADFPSLIMAVFTFFLFTTLVGETLAIWLRLPRAQQVVLAMTTTARNTPLMLGVAAVALPNQPLVYATLITGMLIEFPHLTALSRLFLWKEKRELLSIGSPATSN